MPLFAPQSSSSSRSSQMSDNDDPTVNPSSPITIPRPPRVFVKEWNEISPTATTQPIPCPSRSAARLDSGYATGNNPSPEKPSKVRQDAAEADALAAPVRSSPLPGRDDLQAFRTNVDYTFNARFREVVPELERLLQKHMQRGSISLFQSSKARARKQTTTISIRLMTVGKTFAVAKPAIVIFVCGQQTSSLEGLLRQPHMRQLYQPDDGITPCFDMVIVAEAPRKRFLEDVSVVWDPSLTRERDLVTYCGVQIRLEARSHQRSVAATLGGVVKITYSPGNVCLVGMTAGHVIETLFDSDPEKQEYSSADQSLLKLEEHESPISWTSSFQKLTGKLLYPSMLEVDDDEEAPLIPPRDWALFEMNGRLKIKPNLLQTLGLGQSASNKAHSRGHFGNCLTTAPHDSFPVDEPIEVVLLSGSHQHSAAAMLGELSHLPGGIMLDSDQGFVDAYLLTLDERDDPISVQDGDSGSWVVNPISMEVYGHVVATDCTGDAYVIPLHATFAEMKELLGVESVDLPSTADLLDAALRASTFTSMPPPAVTTKDATPPYGGETKMTMMAMDFSRDRRTSEVLSLCGDLHRDLKRLSVSDDGDSGYGSASSPGRMISFSRSRVEMGNEDDE
ncbi:hypothetical protein B0H63DRAFT_462535 [Podospora didyma]|uniref:Uncharacterized protein n=1 Tax=Podospora didyma TaxID=330526 RepID=A0AAE0P7W0_9PEZI|nr:hypothetical protein B0H63DRAFT_462535 [Podospora didyma]